MRPRWKNSPLYSLVTALFFSILLGGCLTGAPDHNGLDPGTDNENQVLSISHTEWDASGDLFLYLEGDPTEESDCWLDISTTGYPYLPLATYFGLSNATPNNLRLTEPSASLQWGEMDTNSLYYPLIENEVYREHHLSGLSAPHLSTNLPSGPFGFYVVATNLENMSHHPDIDGLRPAFHFEFSCDEPFVPNIAVDRNPVIFSYHYGMESEVAYSINALTQVQEARDLSLHFESAEHDIHMLAGLDFLTESAPDEGTLTLDHPNVTKQWDFTQEAQAFFRGPPGSYDLHIERWANVGAWAPFYGVVAAPEPVEDLTRIFE